MTEYNARFFLACLGTDRNEANQVAFEVTGDEADLQTFSVALLDASNNPWWGCAVSVTDQMRVDLAVELGAGRVPSIKFWRMDAATGVLIQTNVAASIARIGQELAWGTALADAGLHMPPEEV